MIVIASPNFDFRPENSKVDILVLHYTDTNTAKEAIDILTNPERKVSSHYVVDENGDVYSLVPEEKRAWHAGISYWRGMEKLNANSIGIEIVNPGHLNGYKKFPQIQMNSVMELSKDIVKKYKIKPCNVVAHSDIAPDRKKDPGELFDWQFLADNDVGLWHSKKSTRDRYILLKKEDNGQEVIDLQKKLHDLGYKIKINGLFSEETFLVIQAFQRHFMPFENDFRIVDGEWGNIEQEIIEELLLNSK